MLKTHRNEQLDDAVQNFNIVIFQPAAGDCGQLRVWLLAPLGSRKTVATASGPVVLPPRAVRRHAEGEDVTLLHERSTEEKEHIGGCNS